MNKLKPYTKYKPSGIAWLGDIPEHWRFSSLRWNTIVYSGGTPSKDVVRYWENGTIPWLSSGDVNRRKIEFANTFITLEALCNSSAKWIPAKSIIIALAGQGKTKGKVATIEKEMTCNQSLGVITPKKSLVNYKFLAYYLDSKYKQIRGLVGDGLRDGLNLEHIKSITIPLPPLPEQTAISNFLDYKTAKIDRFIFKKKQLIKLLNEQKAGIINDAVTKGLNPNTKTKPSGIEWIGDIPEHWEVRKLKYSVGLNQHKKFDNEENSINKIALENIESKSGKIIGLGENSFEGVGSIFKNGDVLFGKLRPYLAKVVSSHFEGSCVNEILVLTPIKNVWQTEFLKFRMLSSEFIKIVDDSTFGSKMPRASWNFIGGLKISCPPVHEQTAIVSYIEKETSIINKIIATIEKEIALVQEYRTAIIAEAVTGKIDVREYEFANIIAEEDNYEFEEVLSMAAEDEAEYKTQEAE
jgi:type I restriction enzyme, S subunit